MSVCLAPMIAHERLAVPSEHLGILIEPAAARIRWALARQTPEELATAHVLGRPLEQWRAKLRERLGLAGPVVVTGHQPEFLHAGVFAKTVVAHQLAQTAGGSAVFLSVDTDLPKTPRLVVPQIFTGGLRRVEVELPACDPQRPVERQPRASREHWLDFFVRVASIHEHYEASLLSVFSEAWLAAEEEVDFCAAMGRGRAALEKALGLSGVRELRMSALCDTPEFHAFAAHLLLEAERSAAEYNAAQSAYRQRYRVRGTRQPVPPLETAGGRIEVPLWALGTDGRRAPLFLAPAGAELRLFAGGRPIGTVSRRALAAAADSSQPWDFEQAGWRLRPRAITLTAFARLFLADLFIHGVGGAKYGEIADRYLDSLLAVGPAAHCCVTATLHLPLPRHGVQPDEIVAARRRSRDIRFNPQRYLQNRPAELIKRRNEMIRRSDELRAERSRERSTRRMVWEEIRRINERLLRCDPWRTAGLEQRVQTLEDLWQQDQIAFDREYFVGLHLESTLAELVSRLTAELGGD